MRSATPSGRKFKSRRLDLHQHEAVYRTAALLFRPRRQQAGARGFEPRWAALEAASSPRRTLLYQPPALGAGGFWRINYSRSVTFQYASLMNFDQLSIRMLWSA